MTYLLALAGSIVTLGIMFGTAIFKMGHQTARLEALERWRVTIRADIPSRVDELERWRGTMRQDMHEVSDVLESVRVELKRLATIIEERTRQHRQGDGR
jgi:hypothetical protein